MANQFISVSLDKKASECQRLPDGELFNTLNMETLPIEKGFNGRVLVDVERGHITSYMPLRDDQHVASLETLLELLAMAGYLVTKPENISGI